jgi:mono/diheme cytochrome c family protein
VPVVAQRKRPNPWIVTGEVLMWLLFVALLVPAGAVGWAIGHYTGHHGGTVTVTAAASQPKPATSAPPARTTTTTAAAAPDGKAVFVSSGCGACHTFKPAGASATIGPDLDTAPAKDAKTAGMPLAAFLKQSIDDPNAYVAKGFPKGVMPTTFKTSLTSAQLDALVTFLQSG